MKMKWGIKRIIFGFLSVGILLAGKTGTVQAAEKVELTSKVFKDENLLKSVKKYDQDGDGYLDKQEIAAVTSFDGEGSIADISGLEKLTNLTSVSLIYEGTSITLGKKITSLQLRVNTSSIKIEASGAEYISVFTYWTNSYNQETGKIESYKASCNTIDLKKCERLTDVLLSANGMENLKLPSNGGKIKDLRISNASAKTLKLPTAKSITYLSVFDCENLTSVDVSKLSNLKTLKLLNDPNLKSISVNKNKKLEELICANTVITKLDISKNNNLKLVSCPYNKLTKLDCSNNKKLTAVQCYDNKITTLNVNKILKLEEVSCENNKITSLNLKQDRNLKTVTCYNNPLKSLYINSTTNAWKKVNVAPVISSVKQEDSKASPIITLKKNSKINDYIVRAKYENSPYSRKTDTQEGLTFSYKYPLSAGIYDIQAIGNVKYNGVNVYAALTTYKEKITVAGYDY